MPETLGRTSGFLNGWGGVLHLDGHAGLGEIFPGNREIAIANCKSQEPCEASAKSQANREIFRFKSQLEKIAGRSP